MIYILKETQINWNQDNKEELKKILKNEDFGKLQFKTELELAGIPVTEVYVEIRRVTNERKISKAGTVETSVGITFLKGHKKGLRTAYKTLNNKITGVKYYKIEKREF